MSLTRKRGCSPRGARPHPVLLAVEGGGSTGRAVLEFGGRRLLNTIARGLNPVDVGERVFKERFAALVVPLLDKLEGEISSIRASAAIAGCGRPNVARRCKRIIAGLLKEFKAKQHIKVMSDADALVECLIGAGRGIVLLAGTGSICLAVRRRKGSRAIWRVGGWGAYLDEGSGVRIGLEVLLVVLRSLDGRQPPGIVTELICKRYRLAPEQIPSKFLPPQRDRVAALAGVALEAYSLGDAAARPIVRKAAADLADMALAAKAKAHLSGRFEIFLYGGLFRSPIVSRLVRRRLRSALPQATVTYIADILPYLLL
jgi:N-acetylglucosamine kinase-like BadF-type ATPase